MVIGVLDVTLRVVEILDELEIPYVLGGSLASSLVGEPRTTADVDLAIEIRSEQVPALVRAVEGEFYVSEDAARDAVHRHASFNLIHLESVQKVDLFVLGDDPLDRRQIGGRVRFLVQDDPPRTLWVGSVEDQILRKLSWYRAGGGSSDRQWRDVLGMLRVQRGQIDLDALRVVAHDVGLGDLVERALEEA